MLISSSFKEFWTIYQKLLLFIANFYYLIFGVINQLFIAKLYHLYEAKFSLCLSLLHT